MKSCIDSIQRSADADVSQASASRRAALQRADIDILVNRAVIELNRIAKDATLDFALRVGKVIVQTFYDGDLTAWRKRQAKDVSFRKLAKHPDLPMSAAALYRSVAMYEMIERLGIDPRGRLSSSHLRAVLGLPLEEQGRLLALAESNAWPVGVLQQKAAQGRDFAESRGGRKRHSALRTRLQALKAWVQASQQVLEDEEVESDLSPESARLATAALDQAQRACEMLRRMISPHAAGYRSDPPPPFDRQDEMAHDESA